MYNEELELVFPTYEYKSQVEEYVQEFMQNGENRIPGFAGYEETANFEEWLEKVNNDFSRNHEIDERVPATLYLTIRKSDEKIVGNIQIRHILNEFLLNYGGHIGDSVRPSERKKGIATEQIRLALIKAKELGIDNVMMDCDKVNVASAKSIINNGGILENEIYDKDGILIQRYWISLKKRFANRYTMVNKRVEETIYKMKHMDFERFSGDVCYYHFKKVREKLITSHTKVCLIDNDYKWIEFYNYGTNVKLTAEYNDKNEMVEWYFDIARRIGKENEVPYEDDLYLDVAVRSDGTIELLDEDELKDAYNRFEVNQKDYDMAYDIANKLIEEIKLHKDEMKKITDDILKEFMNEE